MKQSIPLWKASWEKTGVPEEYKDKIEAWTMAGEDPNYVPTEEAVEKVREARLGVEKAEKEVKKEVKKAKRAARGKKKPAKKPAKKTKK